MKALRNASLLVAALYLIAHPAAAEPRTAPTVEGPPPAAIEGTITSLSYPFAGGGPIVSLLDALVSFDATGASVRFSDGTAATPADLAVGQRLVAFVEPADPMPRAKSIVVLAQRVDVTLTGAVDAVDLAERTLTVLGFTVTANDRTVFGGPWDGAGQSSLENVRVGDLVLIAAIADGRTLVATRVLKLSPSPMPSLRLHGTVESIGSVSWTIVLRDGTKSVVKIDAETKVVGNPKIGDEVDVLARKLSDGSLLALLIAAFAPPPTVPLERYQGVVKSIGTTAWTVGPKAGEGPDRLFAVDGRTKILGEPRVGDEVGVLAERRADGSFLAIVIARSAPPSGVPAPVSFDGVVNRIAADGSMGLATWLVGDTKVIVSRMTFVIGAPKVGDRVRVEGLKVRDGSVMAAKISKL